VRDLLFVFLTLVLFAALAAYVAACEALRRADAAGSALR
jgi:hypothetical protein